jgi:hypothetical protein
MVTRIGNKFSFLLLKYLFCNIIARNRNGFIIT